MTLAEYFENHDKEEFAQKIGVNLSTVYRWLKGERFPSSKHYVLIKKLTKGKVTADSFYQEQN